MVTKEELDRYITAYQHGSPLITDSAYDALLEEYLQSVGESNRPFNRNKQSDAVNDIVGTLPKTYGVLTPMRENQTTYQEWLKKHVVSRYIVLQPKFDGTSVAYDVATKRFFTRGDFDNGISEDVTDVFQSHISEIEELLRVYQHATAVKFEAILDVETFESMFKEKYRRPRDVVAASITSHNGDIGQLITLIPLRVYDQGKQFIPHELCRVLSTILECTDFREIQGFIDRLLDNGARVMLRRVYAGKDSQTFQFREMHFECDGVVVSSIEEFVIAIISDHNPSETITTIDPTKEGEVIRANTDPTTEVAIKILNLVQETKLVSIQWQFGKSGRITPVAIVQPVKFGNITVTNVGLSTFDRVQQMHLRYNDTVRIMYNIVPYFLDSRGDGDLPIPLLTKCPQCGAPLDMMSLKQVRCVNPLCDGRKLGAIIRYCDTMGMFGVSEGILTKLWDAGYVKSISDLYTMDLMEASEVDGLGEKSMSNIIQSIKHASTNVPVHRWLGSLPCNAVSINTWKTILASVYGMHNPSMNDDIQNMCLMDTPDAFLEKMLWYTHGIGPRTISAINEGIRLYWKDISTIISYITFEPIQTQPSIPMKGYVCLSGTRDQHVMDVLRSKGYEPIDKFNKQCVAVVVPDLTFQSNKTQKARENGIPIYTIRQIDSL